MSETERARQAAERVRRETLEHAQGPDCGRSDCLLHRHSPPTEEADRG